jgi:hypothetical protein
MKSVYPFHDGNFEDFEPVFEHLIAVSFYFNKSRMLNDPNPSRMISMTVMATLTLKRSSPWQRN